MRRGMSSHQSARMQTDEWLTPKHIIDALGPFDLDPCAPIVRPWPTARIHYTVEDNGLSQPWFGQVWLNPPYGCEAEKWLRRLADHGNGIALIFARTETQAFFSTVWARADAVLFLRGRLTFCRVDGSPGPGNSGAPSVLVAYGSTAIMRLRRIQQLGQYLDILAAPACAEAQA